MAVVRVRMTKRDLRVAANVARFAGRLRLAREFDRASTRPGLQAEVTATEARDLAALGGAAPPRLRAIFVLIARQAEELEAAERSRPRPGDRLGGGR